MKQIKVEHTRMHRINVKPQFGYGAKIDEVPVVEGKLVLIPAKEDALLAFNQYNGEYYLIPNKGDRLKMPCSYLKPIIVSETEKIEVGDWVYANGSVCKCIKVLHDGNYELDGFPRFQSNIRKILALPEHFSPKHLQAIVDGKMKDGDKVLVECEKQYHDGDQWNYRIKLNASGHVILHKSEEKMYTRKEIANYIQRFSEAAMTHGSSFNGRLFLTNWDQWFEQNVK